MRQAALDDPETMENLRKVAGYELNLLSDFDGPCYQEWRRWVQDAKRNKWGPNFEKLRGSLKPSEALRKNSPAVLALIAALKARNVRLFGSVLRGEDHEGSDIDVLVDPLPGAALFDLGGLKIDLEELLGVPVDLVTLGDLPETFRSHVLTEARKI